VNRHWGNDDASGLRLSRVIERSSVLGPGERAVVVVQGCHLRCRGCIAAGTHPLDGGERVATAELGERIASLEGLDGVTFTGGEPFLQAAALTRLLDLLRLGDGGLSAMAYSGYRLEWLRRDGSPAQTELLRRLDLLVDGPYVRRLHAPLRWRGSRNQRVHALTARHRAELRSTPDRSAGVEVSIDEDLDVDWVGVPPVPDFEAALAAHTERRDG